MRADRCTCGHTREEHWAAHIFWSCRQFEICSPHHWLFEPIDSDVAVCKWCGTKHEFEYAKRLAVR